MTNEEGLIERAIVCNLIVGGASVYREAKIPSSAIFQSPTTGAIYDAIADLYTDGTQIDIVTVSAKLREVGSKIRGADVIGIIDGIDPLSPTSHMGISQLVNVCRENTLSARAVDYFDNAGRRLKSGENPAAILGEFSDFMETVTKGLSVVETVNVMPCLANRVQHLRELSEGKAQDVFPSSGLSSLDRIKPGWKPGELSIIAARPGHGKTAFGIFLASRFAELFGDVLFFSYEAPEEEIVDRLITLNTGITNTQINNNLKSHIKTIEDTMLRMSDIKIEVVDWSPDIYELKMIIDDRLYKKKYSAVFVDYLQLIEVPGENNRNVAVGIITRTLKKLAMKHRVPIIPFSQFNRDADKGDLKLSMLRDSGSIEQDANSVLFLERPDSEPGYDGPMKGEIRFTWAKNRNGGVGGVNQYHDIATNFFSSQPITGGPRFAPAPQPRRFPDVANLFE